MPWGTAFMPMRMTTTASTTTAITKIEKPEMANGMSVLPKIPVPTAALGNRRLGGCRTFPKLKALKSSYCDPGLTPSTWTTALSLVMTSWEGTSSTVSIMFILAPIRSTTGTMTLRPGARVRV